jgi:hypothetical protein
LIFNQAPERAPSVQLVDPVRDTSAGVQLKKIKVSLQPQQLERKFLDIQFRVDNVVDFWFCCVGTGIRASSRGQEMETEVPSSPIQIRRSIARVSS